MLSLRLSNNDNGSGFMSYQNAAAGRTRFVALTILLGFLAVTLAAPARAGGAARAAVLPAGSIVGGRTIGQWTADWWSWALSFPVEMSPLLDDTGEFGPLGNVGGPVFFVVTSGGGKVSRQYKVPAGQYLLVPIYTYVWTYDDTCHRAACARQIADEFVLGVTKMSVRIDGKPVGNLFSHYERAPSVFRVTVPDDGLYGPGEGGTFPAVSSGYWLMLRPLNPGRHHVWVDALGPAADPGDLIHFTTSLTLDVQPRRRSHGRGDDGDEGREAD
jgi:hypothetical protein